MLEQLQKNSTHATSLKPALSGNKSAYVYNDMPVAVTPFNDYISVCQQYPDYKKVTRLARLTAIGLPVLEGFVIRTFNDEVTGYLGYWMRQRHLTHLLVFFDSCQTTDFQSSVTPQVFTLAELSTLRPPIPEHVAAIVLEGDHQLQHSHALVTAFFADHITCEIVGPGFAIEDLTHGRIVPQEWFSFRRKDLNDDRYKDLGPTDLIQHTITTPEAYLQTAAASSSPLYHSMRELVFELYTPISYERLSELYSYISELDIFYSDEVRGKIVTASFLQQRGLVFWSISGLSYRYSPVHQE